MNPPSAPRGLAALALLLAVPPALAAAPAAQAKPAPQRYVLRGVKLGLADDAPLRTLLLESGRIAAVLAADAEAPPASRVVEGEGLVALPAFLDAYTTTGCETPTPDPDQDLPVAQESDPRIDMRDAGRKGVQPAFRAAEVLALTDETRAAWRAEGFGALLSAPAGEVLAGNSVLATTREAATRDTILQPDVFAHAAFAARGGGYPSTLMGYTAQLRQVVLDARRHAELWQRYGEARPGLRPPYDADLEALLPLLAGARRLACEAERAADIERWIGLADEHGFEIAIVGGREAWRVADLLAARRIPVILTLDWGEEAKAPEDGTQDTEAPREAGMQDVAAQPAPQEPEEPEEPEEVEVVEEPDEAQAAVYEEPLGVRQERRRLWEEGRDCALRLAEAGVPIAFGTGSGPARKLREKVRTLVEGGLPAEVALQALTARSAELLGAAGALGSLEAGHDATLALWTASPFEKDAKLAWLFVDGFAHEFDLQAEAQDTSPPDEGVDASGRWSITLEGRGGTRSGTLVLEMDEDGATRGTLTTEGPDGVDVATEVEGRVARRRLSLEGSREMGGMQVSLTLRAELEGDSLSGESIAKGDFGEFRSSLSGTREPREEVRR